MFNNDHFKQIKQLAKCKQADKSSDHQQKIETFYKLVLEEIINNQEKPHTRIRFGTSGWRGILGKDIFIKSVGIVTAAIIDLYTDLKTDPSLATLLEVSDYNEARKRGCVVGFDNRFGGEILAKTVCDILINNGFNVHYAGESTTGVLSAALLNLNAAFSINLTPSHNPLEYGGFKYNAADGGPAAPELTNKITEKANKLIDNDQSLPRTKKKGIMFKCDSLALWQQMVRNNANIHNLDYDQIINKFKKHKDLTLVIDSVHGASRLHIASLLDNPGSNKLTQIRSNPDVTFGGVAPEPSSENLSTVVATLAKETTNLKLGAIIDPDGDRIRFTDGETEISMNQFGAMAYHFLHEIKKTTGIVAKTVATSNLANQLAQAFNEDVFEPKVGFKEFKPVMGKALVFFEESDGISIIGHTPEKDAYIGLLLAIDMTISMNKNLGEYLNDIEDKYGHFYPDKDGIEVKLSGEQLIDALAKLDKYSKGSIIKIGAEEKGISEIISIDGKKMIFSDGSWLMIRPSGTEPKVRFYVESRNREGTKDLVETAKSMLNEIGV